MRYDVLVGDNAAVASEEKSEFEEECGMIECNRTHRFS